MVHKNLEHAEITKNNLEEAIINGLNPTERQIIKFVHRWEKKISPNTGDIAKNLNLPQSTISSSIKRMKQDSIKKNTEFIFEWEPYHGIALTTFGKSIAEHIERHHHIMEIFLFKTLDLTEHHSHQESELLGINVSCDLANIISKKFNLPQGSLSESCICPEENECVLK